MKPHEQKPNRRLTAIVYADIVGFSAMMGADENATHDVVKDVMENCGKTVERYLGRIVSTAGDAFLAEFPSIVQAVSAAIVIQRTAFEMPKELNSQSVQFRMGINIGDVITDGEDIFGDGVNVAARVQSKSPPGGIAITGAAHEQLGLRADIVFHDTGEHALKNISVPVRIHVAQPPFEQPMAATQLPVSRGGVRKQMLIGFCALLVLVGSAFLIVGGLLPFSTERQTETIVAQQRPVLAVLPFTELGAPPEAAYFAEGFTQDIILNLGRFSEIIVLSWNAVAPYQGSAVNISDIHQNLNARYVIGGTIRRQNEKIRLSVQLTEATSGNMLWSQQIEGVDEDVFALQDEITGKAAGALALSIEAVEQKLTLAQPTSAMSAYDLVLRGRHAMQRVDREANLEARDLFLQAVELDPQYADALAELAWTYVNEVWWGWSEWPGQAIDTGESFARRALNFAPNNVPALSALAELHWMKNDLQSAQEYCEAAIAQNPNAARAHASCAGVLTFSGEIEKGVAHGELTLQLDPEPSSWLFTNHAIGYYFQNRYSDAVSVLKRSANFIDEDPAPHAVMAAAYSKLGRDELAQEQVKATIQLYPFFDAENFAGNLVTSGHSQELLNGLRSAGFD